MRFKKSVQEKSLLEKIQRLSQRTGAKHLDDDAAFCSPLVISTDQFVEETHFRWSHGTPQQIGYKGVVQALSDLAAMAVAPRGLLLSAALAPKLSERHIEDFFAGVEEACHEYAVSLIGGDLTRTQGLSYFDFVVFGFDLSPVTKSGARPGDLVAVTGPLGSARGGWQSIENGWGYLALENIFLKPRAHISTALQVRQQLAPTALTDISDSLSKSLFSLARHSQCGFEIHFDKIPIARELQKFCEEKDQKLRDYVLEGGEDYQLLMTLPSGSSEKLLSDLGLTVIGKVISDSRCLCVEDGKTLEMTEVGWDPFRL